eukprot:6196321-Pleurochrysis_carterae.AAC.2
MPSRSCGPCSRDTPSLANKSGTTALSILIRDNLLCCSTTTPSPKYTRATACCAHALPPLLTRFIARVAVVDRCWHGRDSQIAQTSTMALAKKERRHTTRRLGTQQQCWAERALGVKNRLSEGKQPPYIREFDS